MTKQQAVCLITGANSGIGFATSLELARQGCTVIMVCRNPQRGDTAKRKIQQESKNPNVHLLVADLASQLAIQQLIDTIHSQFPDLNMLINNAGAIFWQRKVTMDGLERTFALNHMAYFMLSNGLLDVLKANAPARIINVGSFAAHSGKINFDDMQSEQQYSWVTAYQQSKLANIFFTTELARLIQGSGVTVNCFNPGNVVTRFGGWLRNLKIETKRLLFPTKYHAMNIIPAEQVGKALAYLALESSLSEISGQVFSGTEIDVSLTALDDVALAKRLWDISENLLKKPFTS